MSLLVDAYNVLHAHGSDPGLVVSELEDLVDLLLRSRYRRKTVRFICDGAARGRFHAPPSSRVSVSFAGAGRKADDLIENILRTDSAARNMLVITSDRRIQRAAERARARWMKSEDFLAQLAADAANSPKPGSIVPAWTKAIPLDPHAITDWLNYFGMSASSPSPTQALPEPDRSAPQSPASPPGARTEPRSAGNATGAQSRGSKPPETADQIIAEALRAWPGRIAPEDFDMERWLKGRIARPQD